MFNGDYRKRKNVSMRPTQFVDPFTNLESQAQQVPQLKQSSSQLNSRFEKRTKDQEFLDGAVGRRKQREFEKTAHQAVVGIQSAYRMYRVRTILRNETHTKSKYAIDTERLSFTTRALLQYSNTVYSKNTLPLANSLELFAYLANLLQDLQTSNSNATQSITRIRRQLQYNKDPQHLIYAQAAARISDLWFNASFSHADLAFLPWEMVRRTNSAALAPLKRQVLRNLLRSKNLKMETAAVYLDGYLELADVVAVLKEIGSWSSFSSGRRASLFQCRRSTGGVELGSDATLRLFTYAKVPENTTAEDIVCATEMITEMLQKVPHVESMEEDEFDEDVDSGRVLPEIIRIFNQLNPDLFTRANLSLDTLGNLVSTLLQHHSRIKDILVLQKVSENDQILAKFTRFLSSNLSQANKVQVRKYIRSSNDFDTWFNILSFRLSQVRDELWLSRDIPTVDSVNLFMDITEYLRELICLCCSPGSGQSQVSPALLTIVNRLAMLNTIRSIDNFDSKFEISNTNHPLVIRLAATVHPASSNEIFIQALDKLLSSDDRGTESMQRVFSNQSDAWLGSVLANAPSLLNLEHRYCLFNAFASRIVARFTHNGQNLRVRRGHVYEDAYQTMLDSPNTNKLRALNVQFESSHGIPEPASGRGVVLEFMNIFMREAFSEPKQLFRPSPHSNKLFPNDEVFKYVPNAKEHYFLVGQLLGTCILAGLQIAVPIARFVIKEIFFKGNLHTVSDLAELDEDLFKSLMSLRDMDPQQVHSLDLDFTYNIADTEEAIELVPGGRDVAVTKENRLLYIELVAQLKLSTGISKQLNSMRDGLTTVLPTHWLRLFNPTEVEFLLYGNEIDKIDVNDWEKYASYQGFTEDSTTIKLFWKILRTRFSQEDLAKLLAFTTSLHRPPLLGFKQLTPRFTIMNNRQGPQSVRLNTQRDRMQDELQNISNVQDLQRFANENRTAAAQGSEASEAHLPELTPEQQQLPTAGTCFNLLRMPPYEDEETMYSKLYMAIHEVEGFAFS